MPSNVHKFGQDGDQDGDIDLFTLEDALYSMGNYLQKHGIKPNSLRSHRRAIYAYNHSNRYVNTVLAVARHVRGS